jgi:hypothetical protein
MLYFISWTIFIKTVLALTGVYYLVICLLFYRREIRIFRRRHNYLIVPLTVTPLLYQFSSYAQADGNNGLNQANTMVRGYFDTATQLMYAIGAISGLIGAVRIVGKTSEERHRMGSEIAIWFGCCIFLVIAATVLKSFYGL